MSVLAWGVAGWLLVVGLYGIATSRNLVHLVACLSVLQSSAYVLLLAIGFRTNGSPPLFKDFPPGSIPTVDPVMQALILTDIVVAATVTALLLALAVQAHKRTGSLNPDDMRAMRG